MMNYIRENIKANGFIQIILSLVIKVFLILLLLIPLSSFSATDLSDRPIFSGNVSGNVALALSVEWPTAVVSAYKDTYATANTYLGYFDHAKCYSYNAGSPVLTGLLFNTGVDNNNAVLAYNTQDPHWAIITVPSGVNASTKNALDNATSYITTTATSLGQNANLVPNGNYTYRSNSFTFPSNVDLSTVSVSFTLNINDSLADIQINGVSTGVTSSATWFSSAAVTIPAGSFTTATNTLSIVVKNNDFFSSLTGFRIDNMTVTGSTKYGGYFEPQGLASGHACNAVTNGRWSGNYLNWALTPVIDPFRLALTGGYRSTDDVNITILEKAYGQDFGAGNTPNKTLADATLVAQSTPYSLSTLTIRSHGLGNKFYITSLADVENPSLSGGLLNDATLLSNPQSTRVYEMFARNQVCKSSLVEGNCTLYPNGSYKPTGLIQKNANKLNFAAFGYLMDGDIKRDGGVLRASMASVGPTGSRPEWNADTGQFITNPANATENNSGVINYLNKFGLFAPGYKSYDPVSELYYATARYFRNKGNVSAYTAGANTAMKDGFPVISTWDDPIKLSCQANFIIGVGDTNSHADADLPGSSIKSANEPPTPTEVTSDFGSLSNTTTSYTDVQTSTNRVGALEGLGNLGQMYTPWCCSNNTFFMAGLAYDLHTRDIRPDIANKQTVTTYWLDTLEVGDRKDFSVVGMRNQFWLAAKYGGFNVPNNYQPYTGTFNINQTSNSLWDSDNNGDPDNYFRANNPRLMIDGLNQAFDNMVLTAEATTSGFALTAPDVSIDDLAFSAGYNAKYWTGNVDGNNLSFDSSGNPVISQVWSTDTTLAAQLAGTGWSSARFIATANCVNGTNGMKTCTGIPFRYASLPTTYKTNLDTVGSLTSVGSIALDYLRGDRSNEGSKFRSRNKFLGDIVNSQIRAVAAPNAPYGETTNTGYLDFKNNYKSRPSVAYVGANDGMLHAFNGKDGKELFAYVPSALFSGPTNTPTDNGLAALAKTSYMHRAYVDSTPVVFDVNFGGGNADWHSLLIGGLGKGGKSYYAIDVTNPASLSNETALATAVKWEFTHKDLGYSYGRPLVVKAGGKWLVILTSGYNNADGKGYFFILDAKTGALIAQIGTGVGSLTTDAGLANVTAFIADGRDFTADAAYAGDLLGNVWRLDLTGATSNSYPSPTKIAYLESPSGGAQPITTAPVVEVDESTSKRYVFVGTGRLLADSDINNTQEQSFYAINDGTANAFYTSATLPTAAGSFPITRDKLINITSIDGIGSGDAAKPMGYYINLGFGTNGVSYRINTPIDSSAGIVAFAANLISGDECSISDNATNSANYHGYAMKYGTGKTVLLPSYLAGTGQYYSQGSGVVSGVNIYKKPGANNLSVNFSNTVNGNSNTETESASQKFQMLNWRSLPTND